MRHQLYFPVRIGDQIVWLRNIKTKLPGYVAVLGLNPTEVAAFLLDVDNAVYALEDYRGAIAAFTNAAYQRVHDALHDETIAGDITWLPFTVPSPAPTAVAYGCLHRIFAFVSGSIRKSAAYDIAIGEDLGIESAVIPAPPAVVIPEFSLRTTAGGKMEVVWHKGPFDAVRLQFDLAEAGMQNDIDLRPNYTLNWLPPAGTSVIIKVRLMYILKGQETGNWSAWQQWTLTGV